MVRIKMYRLARVAFIATFLCFIISDASAQGMDFGSFADKIYAVGDSPIDRDAMTPETSMEEAGLAYGDGTNMDLMEVVYILEADYDVHPPLEIYAKINTLGDLLNLYANPESFQHETTTWN